MKKIKKYKDQKYCGRDSVLVCLDCHRKIPLPRWASGPITSWETDRETVETVSDFILGSSKITADGDCSHEIKRCLLPESYDQPGQHIKKQKHHFANKGPFSQGYGFPVVMHGCESWTEKKAECQRIDAFELWCWRRLLRVLWTARRSVLTVYWED